MKLPEKKKKYFVLISEMKSIWIANVDREDDGSDEDFSASRWLRHGLSHLITDAL